MYLWIIVLVVVLLALLVWLLLRSNPGVPAQEQEHQEPNEPIASGPPPTPPRPKPAPPKPQPPPGFVVPSIPTAEVPSLQDERGTLYVCVTGDLSNLVLEKQGAFQVIDDHERTWWCYKPKSVADDLDTIEVMRAQGLANKQKISETGSKMCKVYADDQDDLLEKLSNRP